MSFVGGRYLPMSAVNERSDGYRALGPKDSIGQGRVGASQNSREGRNSWKMFGDENWPERNRRVAGQLTLVFEKNMARLWSGSNASSWIQMVL